MLSPHVFPLVPHPGLAPELSLRSGQGNWEPYALASPSDRLLPFVLTRRLVPGNSRWLNCATIVDAVTEQVVVTLTPTGQTVGGPGLLGLVLAKVVDTVNSREHFLYYGAIIPGLVDELPCGRGLRLLLDNAWQSARFTAVPELNGPHLTPASNYQRFEWSHPGPLSGIPYGTGFTQRFYSPAAGLQYADPREVEQSTQDATTGVLRQDFLAQYERRTTNVALVPAYLSDAVQGARTHKSFSIDGEPWKLADVKSSTQGTDGGRWTLALTLEALQPLQSRLSCPPVPLVPLEYDPVLDAARAYRCGDASDTASDYMPTDAKSCELDGEDSNTGFVLTQTKDYNPYSSTYGQAGPPIRTLDFAMCPIGPLYKSAYYSEYAAKSGCAPGLAGSSVKFESPAGKFSSRATQQDADQQAIKYVRSGKQANADALGACQLQRRTVSLTNVVQTAKAIRFSLTRSDSVGSLTVIVSGQAEVDSGGSTMQQRTLSVVVPDGATATASFSLNFTAPILSYSIEIAGTNPTDYDY